MIKKALFLLTIIALIPSILLAGTISNTYSPNAEIPIGGSSPYYVSISGAPSNAVITSVEAKFTYS